ncbi:hypothetical protein SCHPADRAFT_910074 [Schizopora paradoxa]|uniref:Uncharacterized protein n=1 Tax=Schizopora paradoxa TaxID=27342 RepID=A0A0H2R5Z4_9AGAM|nr:hypothetical protein SCHPADRAFT_910074 [Schizopora paradoxa]
MFYEDFASDRDPEEGRREQHRKDTLRETPGLGGPIAFNNISDGLFARLFMNDSPEDCIPWQFCDLILSVINDPRFNSKDVTFKNGGDMFCSVGQLRGEAWSMVEARSKGMTTIPQVVLEGVFDVLREDMQRKADIQFLRSRDSTSCLRDVKGMLGVGRWNFRATICAMALVHSSWLGYARRLLGLIALSEGPVPNTLRSPLLGVWTKDLYLSYRIPTTENSPIAPFRPQNYFLKNLCARIPNIRLAHFYLCSMRKITTEFITTLCETLSALPTLEDLTIQADGYTESLRVEHPHDISPLIYALSETRHPNLRSLRLDFRHDLDSPLTVRDHSTPSPLVSLPKLHTVGVSYSYGSGDSISRLINTVTWLRASPESFSVNVLRIDCPLKRNQDRVENLEGSNPSIDHILRPATILEFDLDDGKYDASATTPSPSTPNNVIEVVAAIIGRCSSARHLMFRRILWTRSEFLEKLRAQVQKLGGIEELTIVTFLPHVNRGQRRRGKPLSTTDDNSLLKRLLHANDRQLSETIGLGFVPRLRKLNVSFDQDALSKAFFESCAEVDDAGVNVNLFSKKYNFLLPACRLRCSEMGIELHVDII